MLKNLKIISFVLLGLMISIFAVACGSKPAEKSCEVAEKVELSKTVLSEVEFENADTVKIKQDCDEVVVSGTIEKMSDSQKATYGVEEVTHVAVVKFVFDKERTLESFEIKGNTTKVFSTDETVENYTGKLSELLDNEAGEDAFTTLILSAHTKNYELKSVYTDGTESLIKLKIEATLANANAEW